jgi:hypothetical protein
MQPVKRLIPQEGRSEGWRAGLGETASPSQSTPLLLCVCASYTWRYVATWWLLQLLLASCFFLLQLRVCVCVCVVYGCGCVAAGAQGVLLCALCSVLCALCSVLCALCSVLCALCSVLCALCSVLCVQTVVTQCSVAKSNSNCALSGCLPRVCATAGCSRPLS